MKQSGAVGRALQQLEIVVQAVARNRKYVERKGLNIRDVERSFLIVKSGRKKGRNIASSRCPISDEIPGPGLA